MTKSLADQFVDAVAGLNDLTTIRTNPELTRLRTDLQRDYRDSAVSDDIVRTLEVLGIANAVTTLFCDKPHCDRARQAAVRAGMLWANARAQFSYHKPSTSARTNTPMSGIDNNAFRVFLRTRLDWVHEYGTLVDGASDCAITCLSPVTAYLQLILAQTPVEDWAAAVSGSATSPLAFAWALARRSPGIGKQTADVAALVTMGCHIPRLMADERVRAEEAKRSVTAEVQSKLLEEGVYAALRTGVRLYFTELATRLRSPPTVLEGYQRMHNPGDADGLWATVRNAARVLGEEGDQYAQILGKGDATQERERVVNSIRWRVGFILCKAEPPVPDAVLQAVADLATVD
ncbi:hypothetical protein BOTBODRAFT_145421 [Botryobasidium botryosum FD-172 SS1]|uniref:Uncharacterized protein n=1 Tax=Botryobasidium botryosum (strain FD-172 SS1) TaxID=930990 RepID=A0A067MSR7_BOTB1|nr:hypothetical protein BOTBODRAFT_145421 [Botryobasidium botryosum FD-172 SS1]